MRSMGKSRKKWKEHVTQKYMSYSESINPTYLD